MKGTVIKRGAKWAVVVDLGRDPSGKRIRKWHSGYPTKRDAEGARVEILSRLQGRVCATVKSDCGRVAAVLAGRPHRAR